MEIRKKVFKLVTQTTSLLYTPTNHTWLGLPMFSFFMWEGLGVVFVREPGVGWVGPLQWVTGITICTKEGHRPFFQGEIINKERKYVDES